MFKAILWTFFLISLSPANTLFAADRDADCPAPEIPTTHPKPIDVAAVLQSLRGIHTDKGEFAFDMSQEAMDQIHQTFGGGKVLTKMEQFYTMLFILQGHSKLPSGVVHTIPGREIAEVLKLSGVFPSDEIPLKIGAIRFRSSSLTPMYEVVFKDSEVRLPVNGGKGFRTQQHGLCQEARALIFRSPFRFYLKRLENGNLKAYKFENVDIEGRFGTRGVLDIDLNYVTLMSVTFIRHTPLGYVQAKVAEKEFEVNEHGWFLKMITSLFSDTTKQAIDW